MSEVCGYRWHAPRHDVPESTLVEHVCGRVRGHSGTHVCSCTLIYVNYVNAGVLR